MWKVKESDALEICVCFSSMSLAKISPSSAEDEKEEYVLRIHDLYLEYVRRMAGETRAEWHRRLLNGHIAAEISAPLQNGDNLLSSLLDFAPRAWWQDDVDSKQYIP